MKTQEACHSTITRYEADGIWSTPTLGDVVCFSFLKVLKQNSFLNHFQGSAHKLVPQWESAPPTEGYGKAAKHLEAAGQKGKKTFRKAILSMMMVNWPRSNKTGQRSYIFQCLKCKRETDSPCRKVYSLCLQASQQLILTNRVTAFLKIKREIWDLASYGKQTPRMCIFPLQSKRTC